MTEYEKKMLESGKPYIRSAVALIIWLVRQNTVESAYSYADTFIDHLHADLEAEADS